MFKVEKEFHIDGWYVPVGFYSDGLTGAPESWFGNTLTNAGIWHDWARRHLVHYNVITVQEADRLFHKFLIQLGAPRWLARLYWFWVKITRNRYKTTQPIRPEWQDYLRQKKS